MSQNKIGDNSIASWNVNKLFIIIDFVVETEIDVYHNLYVSCEYSPFSRRGPALQVALLAEQSIRYYLFLWWLK